MSVDDVEPPPAVFSTLYARSAQAVRMGMIADPGALMQCLESVTLVRWQWIVSRENGRRLIPVGRVRSTVAGLVQVMEKLQAEYPDAFLSHQTRSYDLRSPEGRAAFALAVEEIAVELREVMQ